MLKVGDCIYRFKFDPDSKDLLIVKQTFRVIDAKFDQGRHHKDFFKFRCEENPKFKYRDGSFTSIDNSIFEKVKASGNCIYVTLLEDDELKASTLINRYFNSKVANLRNELSRYEIAQSKLQDFMYARY